jgi:hypothetical protein
MEPDPAMPPLKLTALDSEDLEIISAHMQDATLLVGDISYLPRQKKLALVANRFDWEQRRVRWPGRQRQQEHVPALPLRAADQSRVLGQVTACAGTIPGCPVAARHPVPSWSRGAGRHDRAHVFRRRRRCAPRSNASKWRSTISGVSWETPRKPDHADRGSED